MPKNIVITKERFDKYIEPLRQLAEPYGYTVIYETEPLKVGQYLADAEIVMGLGRKILDGTTEKLKWVCAQSAGVDWYLNSKYRPQHEVILTNSAGAFGVGVAENAVMLLLEALRRQYDYQQFVKERVFRYDLVTKSIEDLNIAVMGTGDLGQCVAKRLRGFDPAGITGVNVSGRNPGDIYDRIITQDKVDDILPETDAIILCLPGTPETKGFIDRRRIDLMPDDAVIVNVGRGNAIVQDDLISALKEGRLWGAGLDVFEKEPLKEDDPIYDCPNLVMTPHSGGSIMMDNVIRRNFEIFYDNLERYLTGKPMKNIVDPQLGY